MDKKYLDWIVYEKEEAESAYLRYKGNSQSITNRLSATGIRKFSWITAAAAILLIALSTGLFLKKDQIFGPKYTQEQIELSYEHSLKTLALFSETLSKGTAPIKTSVINKEN